MANTEREIVDAILADSGSSAAKLGLRFDRVVVRLLAELRGFAEAATPDGVTILVTVTAPIRLPAKTAADLRREINALVSARTSRLDRSLTVQGNSVRLRLLEHSSNGAPRLIGFVHNPDSAPEALLDLAEHWLGARKPADTRPD